LHLQQPSIHQNYNPMNISKFETDTLIGSNYFVFQLMIQ